MSDPRPDLSSPSTAVAETVPPGEQPDPFLKLHKMSTTAGLGSGDYVAINGNAIAAALLGIASAFVLMGTNLLLLIPAVGIICAIFAFRQISSSNGTQTGKGLAALGLILALGFGGFFSTREIIAGVRNHADSEQIVALIHEFGQDIVAGDYTKGYALWDQRFQGRVAEPAFQARWEQYNHIPTIGKLTGLDWTHLLEFDTNVVTGEREATGQVLFSFANIPGKDRQPMEFRKRADDGKWVFFDAPAMFPATAAAGAPGGAPPTPGSPVAGPPAPTK